jgi:hypothetical protein
MFEKAKIVNDGGALVSVTAGGAQRIADDGMPHEAAIYLHAHMKERYGMQFILN